METIYILWLRQIKRFSRSKARIIGSVMQSLLFLVSFGFGMGNIFERAGEGNYLAYLAPGIIAMSVLFSAIFTGIDVIWDRQFGFLKETLVAPVPRLKIMIGRTLGGATTSLFQGLIVFVVSLILGFRPNWSALPLAIVFILLIALFFTAFGTAIGSLLKDMQAFQLIMNFVVMPTFFLSGALFPVDSSSPILQKAILLNPLAYGVDGLRGSLTGQFYFGLGIDFLVLSSLTIAALIVGSRLFAKIEI